MKKKSISLIKRQPIKAGFMKKAVDKSSKFNPPKKVKSNGNTNKN